MQSKFEKLKTEALLAVKSIKNKMQLEELEIKLLGRKSGELTNLLKGLKDLGEDAKKEVGQLANAVKKEIEEALAAKKKEFSVQEMSGLLEKESIDITQPALPPKTRGHFHPNTLIQNDWKTFLRQWAL